MVSMSGLIAGEISVLLLNDLLQSSEQQTLVSRLLNLNRVACGHECFAIRVDVLEVGSEDKHEYPCKVPGFVNKGLGLTLSVVLVAVPGLLVVSTFPMLAKKEKRSTCMVLKCGLSSEQNQTIQVKRVNEQI